MKRATLNGIVVCTLFFYFLLMGSDEITTPYSSDPIPNHHYPKESFLSHRTQPNSIEDPTDQINEAIFVQTNAATYDPFNSQNRAIQADKDKHTFRDKVPRPFDPFFPTRDTWSSCPPETFVSPNPFGKTLQGLHYDVDYNVSMLVPPDEDTMSDTLCQPGTNASLGLTVLSRNPCVVHVANFLPAEDCDEIVRASRLVAPLPHEALQVPYPPYLQQSLRERLHHLLGEFFDGTMEILRYPAANKEKTCGKFAQLPDVHAHYFPPKTFSGNGNVSRFSLLYLTTVTSGGVTWFPYANCRNQNRTGLCCGEFGLRVKPVKGSLVIIYEGTKSGGFDGLSAHNGCGGNEQEKMALVVKA